MRNRVLLRRAESAVGVQLRFAIFHCNHDLFNYRPRGDLQKKSALPVRASCRHIHLIEVCATEISGLSEARNRSVLGSSDDIDYKWEFKTEAL